MTPRSASPERTWPYTSALPPSRIHFCGLRGCSCARTRSHNAAAALWERVRAEEQPRKPQKWIRDGGEADERTIALAMLADACGYGDTLFPELDAKSRKARMDRLAKGPWAAEDTGDAIGAITRGVARSIGTADAGDLALVLGG